MISYGIYEFLRKYWKQIGAVVLVLVLVAISYALGRYVAPQKVITEEKIKIVEVEKEKIVYVDRQSEVDQTVKNDKKHIRKEKIEVTHPDGTRETKETETHDTDNSTENTQIQIVEKIVEKEVIKYVDREVEKRVEITNPSPDWKITPMLGLQGQKLYLATQGQSLDLKSSFVAGVQVERRIWGPVFAGAWGLSTKEVGVSLTLEF